MEKHYITPDELNEILEKRGLIYKAISGNSYLYSSMVDTPIDQEINGVLNDINAKVVPARDTPKMVVWATRDYSYRKGDLKAVSLSKSVLGAFMFYLLQFGGVIRSTYVMNKDYPGSFVEILIELPEGKKDEFMKISGFHLRKPSILTPA